MSVVGQQWEGWWGGCRGGGAVLCVSVESLLTAYYAELWHCRPQGPWLQLFCLAAVLGHGRLRLTHLSSEVSIPLRKGVAAFLEFGLALKEPHVPELGAGGRGWAPAPARAMIAVSSGVRRLRPPPVARIPAIPRARGIVACAERARAAPRAKRRLRAPFPEGARAVGARTGGAHDRRDHEEGCNELGRIRGKLKLPKFGGSRYTCIPIIPGRHVKVCECASFTVYISKVV